MSDTIQAGVSQPQGVGVVPPLSQPNRRPRVREVSSRFMSSSSSSNNTHGVDFHSLQHVQSPKHVVGGGGILTPSQARLMQQRPKADNTVIRRSYSDSPLGSHNYNKVIPPPRPAQSKQRGAAVVKLFKENNAGKGEQKQEQQQQLLDDGNDNADFVLHHCLKIANSGTCKSSSRPDTPIASAFTSTSAADRFIPSRFRQLTSSSQSFHRSQTSISTPASAAAKLLQSSGLSLSANSATDDNPTCLVGDAKLPPSNGLNSEVDEGSCRICPNSPLLNQDSSLRTWSLNADVRSSMPDTRLLLTERSCNSGTPTTTYNMGDSHLNPKFSSASPCSRSLNLPLSNSVKMGNLSLPPPHPPLTKLGADADAGRKGKKVFAHQGQVHSLKLLHNHYLQWCFANAKAEASLRSQTRDTERKLHSLAAKISNMSEAVKCKRDELGLLQRIKTLSTIVESQMPYLDEWSALQEDHSTSLSGTTQALVNSLVRLPVSGNVQVDIKEVGEALKLAAKVMEMICIHVQRFMPKANEMDTLMSELARSVGGERVLIEECGDILLKTCTLQVADCSLRGHLMQLKNDNLPIQN